MQETIDKIAALLKEANALLLDLSVDQEKVEFEKLKALLYSEQWPLATNPASICNMNDAEEKSLRAYDILDVMIGAENLKGKKLLDFGCGEGYSVERAGAFGVSEVTGYDVVKKGDLAWGPVDNKLLTTSLEEVKQNGPYDAVLMYDVLDHIVDKNAQLSVLETISDVLETAGKIYVICHPFVGRHGGHLYEKINKAFVHLIFTKDELASLGYDLQPIQETLFPVSHYKSLFSSVGLLVKSESLETIDVEPFFWKNASVKKRIMDKWSREIDDKFPEPQLKQVFVIFELTKV